MVPASVPVNRSDEAFAVFKAPHIAEAIAKNLPHVTPGSLMPWSGGDGVAVIGAGHTLPGELATHWRPVVLAVNSALMALASRGITPEAFVCRESIDTSEHIRKASSSWRFKPQAILDIGVHPNVRAMCAELGLHIHWFVPATTQTHWISEALGVEPLYAGNSNVTAAVAIAARSGALSIDLYGCSRAFSAEGRAYASGSDWSTVRLLHVEAATRPDGTIDHYVGHIGGLEGKEAMHAASGQRAPLRVERVVPVTAVDGSRRWALEPLETDRRWLEVFAARHRTQALMQYNPDVAIAGWGHAPRLETDVRHGDPVADIARQANLVQTIGAAVLDGGDVADVPGIMGGSPFVDFAGVGARVRLMHALEGRPGPSKVAPIVRAWMQAADVVRGWGS